MADGGNEEVFGVHGTVCLCVGGGRVKIYVDAKYLSDVLVLTYIPGFLCRMVDCGEEEDVVVGRVEGLEVLEEGLSGTALLRGVAGTAQLGCVRGGGEGGRGVMGILLKEEW